MLIQAQFFSNYFHFKKNIRFSYKNARNKIVYIAFNTSLNYKLLRCIDVTKE